MSRSQVRRSFTPNPLSITIPRSDWTCPTTATGTANLPLRQRLCVEITLTAIDRRTGEPGDFRDNRETASTSSPHLGRGKQSPSPLIELRANRLPSQPNGGLVDHATDLPRLAENRNPQHLSQSDARSADDDSVIVRSVLNPNSGWGVSLLIGWRLRNSLSMTLLYPRLNYGIGL